MNNKKKIIIEKIINDIKIDVPEGMEAYLIDNTIKFRPIKNKFDYDNIAKELFYNKYVYYPYSSPNRDTDIHHVNIGNIDFVNFPLNCSSKKQVDKLFAINKLMNIARYLNEYWKPNWEDYKQPKYYFAISNDNTLIITFNLICNCSLVYFKSEELAKKAIEILGEDIIKLALCTDW